MNKKTKMMLVLLSAASVTAGVIGLAGCKTNKTPSTDTQINSVYAEYKAYAEANGQEVLTYEQWLETIKTSVTIKGDDGATPSIGANGNWFIGTTDTGVKAAGTDGAIPSIGDNGNWFIGTTDTGIKAAGKNGEDGVSIEEVSLSADGTKLVIKYSNGNKDEIPLPEEVTHVHKYDNDNVTVLMMPTETADGLGYKKCEDDEHIELVVLKRYEVKLTLEGKPVSGVGVVINGKTAVSDDFGVAKFADFGDYNDYIVTLDTDKYEVAGTYRTGETYGADMELKLSSKLAAGNVVPGSGSYAFNFKYDSWYQEYDRTAITFMGGETEARKFKLTSEAAYFSIKDDEMGVNELVVDGEYVAIVAPGASITVYVTVDPYGFPMDEDLPSVASYIVKVEELVPPEFGTVEELPFTFEADETVSLSADNSGWVYYSYSKGESISKSFTFDLKNTEVQLVQVVLNNTKKLSQPVDVVAGEKVDATFGSQYYAADYIFRVRATGDDASFSMAVNAPLGSVVKPIPVTIDVEAEYDFNAADAIDEMNKWFKFTCTVKGAYFIEPTKTAQLAVYKDNPDGSSIAVVESQLPINLDEGEYYFKVNKEVTESAVQCGFKIRMFSNEDYGFSAEFAKPVELENSRATVTAGASDTYYKITADKEGLLRLSGAGQYEAYIVATGGGFNTSRDVNAGDEVVIVVKAGVTVNIAVLSEDELQETHKFTVVDNEGANVEGAKVTVSDNAGKVIAEGTTDAQGTLSLEYIPGKFNVVVAKDGYYFDLTDDTNRAGTSESKTEYEFKLRNDAFSVTLTVKSGDKVFPNAKLTFITSFDQKVVKTATTDAKGQVTVNLYIPASGQLEYTVDLDPEVEGNEDYYYSSSMCYFNQYYKPETATVDFKEYAVYTVTVKNKDGKGVKGVTVSLSQANYDWWDDVYTPGKTVASGVTNADGVVSIKCQEILVMSGMSGLGVSFSTVPEGYSLEFTAIADQSKDIEVTAVGEATNPDPGPDNPDPGPVDPDNPDKPDPDEPDVPVVPEKKPVNGATNVNLSGNAVVEAGVTDIVNAAETNFYMFTAAEAGTYSLLINDAANAGYVSFLSYGTGNMASRFTKLIENGKEISVACDLILGKNRGFNKVYELTVTLRKGQSVAIGYTTATGEGGTAQLSVKKNEAVTDPGTEAPSTVELKVGENVITLGSKPVTLTFTVPVANGNYIVEWNNPNVTFYEFWDGEPDLEYPVEDNELYIQFAPEGQEVSYYIVPNGQTTVTVTVTEFNGPMGY